MGQPQAQLNPMVDLTQVTLSVLNAAPNGSTDDSVLRFDNSVISTADGATGLRVTVSAAAGTVIQIYRPGLYLVQFAMSQPASVTTQVGISLNAALAALNTDPVGGTNGVLVSQIQTTPAATVVGINLSCMVAVRKQDIRVGDPTAGAGLAAIRLHATNGAGATVAAAITAASARAVITRMIGLS